MITVDFFAGKSVALIGLAGSGLATAKALHAGGARVLVHDDNPDRLQAGVAAGFIACDLARTDWSRIAALILAPGVPLTHPQPHWSVALAKAAGVEIIGDLELFYRIHQQQAPQIPVIAITGTNGKSTTTALIAHILATAGFDVQMGGNIGTPVLALDPPQVTQSPDQAGQVYVLEMSSYQIDLSPSLKPTIGILLNISPDHLDRHGSMPNYEAIKERLVTNATQLAVTSEDDAPCQAIGERLSARRDRQEAREGASRERLPSDRAALARISTERGEETLWRAAGHHLYAPNCKTPFADLTRSETLRGQHNRQNALSAAAACRHLGVRDDQIAEALLRFPGLAHRMEVVARRGSVLFVNDSKATNADAAARALAAYDHIYWIAGGRAKAGGIASLTEYFPKLRHSYVIGEAAELFAETLKDASAPVTLCGSLAQAVAAAAQEAQRALATTAMTKPSRRSGLAETDVRAEAEAGAGADVGASGEQVAVLLSPACASLDQFASFEARGDAFKEAVLTLEGITPF